MWLWLALVCGIQCAAYECEVLVCGINVFGVWLRMMTATGGGVCLRHLNWFPHTTSSYVEPVAVVVVVVVVFVFVVVVVVAVAAHSRGHLVDWCAGRLISRSSMYCMELVVCVITGLK